MGRSGRRLAKLSEPRIHGAVARERLFAWIDSQNKTPVIWIVGPAGAGKTTLVASYLSARALSPIWYQIDAGDADPSAFFAMLAQALPAMAKRKAPLLPKLTPEYLLDLPGFARRFFRSFFARLPESTTLVFDNHQDAATPLMDTLLREAFTEMPSGNRVVIISRVPPPPELARLQVNGGLAVLDWGQLRFTPEETHAVARAYAIDETSLIAELHHTCDGWAAGIVLLLENARRARVAINVPTNQPYEKIFDYLATEVFERAEPEVQSFLRHTALLPHMTIAMAQKVSGDANAERILAKLYREHFFTDRREASEVTYQYHALFRGFLKARLAQDLTLEERQALFRKSAAVLTADGQIDAAIDLLAEAQVWPEAVQILLQHAKSRAEQGQFQTLQAWINRIPEAVQAEVPWIGFWKGVCQLFQDPPAARRDLKGAYERFVTHDDRAGQMMAAVAMIESYYLGWERFRELEPWVDIMLELLAHDPVFSSPEIELRTASATAWALFIIRPQEPRLHSLMQRASVLLETDIEVNQKMAAYCQVLNYHSWMGHGADTRLLINHIDTLVVHPGVTPFNRAFYLGMYRAYNMTCFGAVVDESLRGVHEALEIIRANGLYSLEPALLIHEVFPSWLKCDLQTVERLLNEIEPKLQPSQSVERYFYLQQRATTELMRGKADRAAEYARQARTVAVEHGITFAVAWSAALLALCVLEQGDARAALEQYEGTRHLGSSGSRMFRFEFGLIEADIRWQLGERDESLRLLRECLAISREEGLYVTRYWVPARLGRLFAIALEAGIEVEHTERLIRECGLLPPSPEVEHWPWPVKIYTLGRFAVLHDNTPLASTGKSQHRLLDFLQVLIALGGRGVSAATLAETLWPGADADSALSTLGSTLHRVRKLLGDAEAITLSNGVVSIDARRCWVDVWAFERGTAQIAVPTAAGGRDLTGTELDTLQNQVLRLYTGPFLMGEAEETWMLRMRERLRSRFHRAVIMLGDHRERAQDWCNMADLYQRALEIDDRSEDLYRRLLTIQVRLGRGAEGLSTYERCRCMLAEGFGNKPSQATEALRAQLVAGV
jgi:ATP/maltotriose-dependent transcriptional regulator MalT/DNA-binding SARP family transcriptional activator